MEKVIILREYKNIVLTGFMGSGKSFLGNYIAKKLNKDIIDTDEAIKRYSNMSIMEIFDLKGERYFRDLEFEICEKICNLNNYVIATGGGTLLYKRNLELFFNKNMIVFVDTPFEECYKRIKNTNRPLLKSLSEVDIKRLYLDRKQKYMAISDISIDGSLFI